MTIVKGKCCKDCNPCPNCYNQNKTYLISLVDAIESKITDKVISDVSCRIWGYSAECSNLSEEDFDRLSSFKEVLNRHIKALCGGYKPCLCPEELQTLIEKVLDKVAVSKAKKVKKYKLKDVGREEFLRCNPSCDPNHIEVVFSTSEDLKSELVVEFESKLEN